MKLIVWKSYDLMGRYAPELLKGVSCFDTKHVFDVVLDRRMDDLRGYAFDEVLWVGFENNLEVTVKVPVDLLAQLLWSKPKYHFCKPLEKKPQPMYRLYP